MPRAGYGAFGLGSDDVPVVAGMDEAARLVYRGVESAIEKKTVTYDLERQMEGATLLSCSAFGDAIIANM